MRSCHRSTPPAALSITAGVLRVSENRGAYEFLGHS